MNRRKFLRSSVSCGAYVFGMAAFAPALTRQVFASQEEDNVVVSGKWGRVEQIADGVWAVISTPFGDEGDFTTVCNGGIIAGDESVLVIESFMSREGAAMIAQQAKQLTGKWPTDVVSTHFHGDHTAGHRGYFTDDEQPRIWLTDSTKTAAEESFGQRGMRDNEFQNVSSIDAESGATIDLGNRQVNLVPRRGHTASDVTIELVEPKIIFSGDLFFNRMFPNYSDATPRQLMEYCTTLLETPDTMFVPGHGPTANLESVEKYKVFLEFVEARAMEARADNKTPAQAKEGFELPEELSDWLIWNPSNATRAFAAWNRQLDAEAEAEAEAAGEAGSATESGSSTESGAGSAAEGGG